MRPFISLVAVGLICISASCRSEDEPAGASAIVDNVLAPTTNTVTLGADYVDTQGRLWKCMGLAKLVEPPPEASLNEPGPPPSGSLSYEDMSEDELAEKIRAVQLLNGYEYRLAEPDYLLARKIRAMKVAPVTDGHRPDSTPAEPTSSTLKPQHIFPPDTRANVTSWNVYPSGANGLLQNGCTTALIGPHTGITAAHCVYKWGWLTGTSIAYAAFNDGNPATGEEPWGRWQPIGYAVPGQWVTNSNDYTWDFAVVEWGSSNPGYNVGWFGTTWWFGNPVYLHGYSADSKPAKSQWFRTGDMAYISSAQYIHYSDVVPGDSGGVFYDNNHHATCVQSTEGTYTDISGIHHFNACRRWDSATYNFFDVNAQNWP
jgi:V8-like Glu-specific endopeptidase